MTNASHLPGSQRLSLRQLQQWEQWQFGMFIHFGMSTFEGAELSTGNLPSTAYAPDQLDVDQWVSVARDAGMKYAVLTTKHVAGHCLWPSRLTDYHVGTSSNPTDVVEAFVNACAKRGVIPGLYYCSWDNHHRFGSVTRSDVVALPPPPPPADGASTEPPRTAVTSPAYREFQSAQIQELLTQYGAIGEVWIDIPEVLPRAYRQELYQKIATLQPEAVIMMNNGISDGSDYPVDRAWPADLIAIERFLPNSHTGHVKWRHIEGRDYYLPGEVCDPIGKEWFYVSDDPPRSDAELLGMYLTTVSRGCNLLLDVGPDQHGLLPASSVAALSRLRAHLDALGM